MIFQPLFKKDDLFSNPDLKINFQQKFANMKNVY